MRKTFLLSCVILFSLVGTLQAGILNEPDSMFLFSYGTSKNDGRNGLHFAWSTDRKTWHPIGPEYSYLRSDYGRWGAEKRMIDPFLFRDATGEWHCMWTLNERDGVFAHAASDDLAVWGRQSYTYVPAKNCLNIEIVPDKEKGQYRIIWTAVKDEGEIIYSTTTKDFKNYTPTAPGFYSNVRESIVLSGRKESGTIHKVERQLVDNLIKTQQLAAYKRSLHGELMKDDKIRFSSLGPVDATVTVNLNEGKKISDLLLGVFFEDINYAADGGLYAELIQNRGFEYMLEDREKRDDSWDNKKAWSVTGDNPDLFTIDTVAPIHPNNRYYAVLQIEEPGIGLVNEGFDGISLKAGEKYNFSIFARVPEGKTGKLEIRLVDKVGKVYGTASTKGLSRKWKKYETVLIAKEDVAEARLEIIPQLKGTVHLDMISLFPQKTFKGRKNGLRADLAQTIADMKPRFVRFPGGCVAHGDGLENMYRWKNTIGPLEGRKPQRNLWGYHQTAGLGYFEYFQFCEDIGAEPVPVVPAGVPCQNSGTGGAGQQGGIPIRHMDHYVQEVLDLIEYANGDVKTTWGKKRAEAGHPKPFNLKYIGVGNEDLITDIFEERFTMIFNAVKEKYPEITVIGTVGPYSEGTDYNEGWKIADKLSVPMVDEHYYQVPGWFIYNQDYYDRYDRNKSKVYLGEYAAHVPDRSNNIETALAEALYLTALERNGDVVSMTSYAPLLAKEGHTQWNPDLIYFNNTEVKPTVGYYVQQLYGQHAGDMYFPQEIELSRQDDPIKKRIAVSVVRDSKSNDLIVKVVNMLPAKVNTIIRLDGEANFIPTAEKIVLSGKPNDRNTRPVTGTIQVGNLFPCEVPAYSFIVIRMKAPQEPKKK